jgi:hypothetical protein
MREKQRFLEVKLIQPYPVLVEQNLSVNSGQGVVSTNSLSGMTSEDIWSTLFEVCL